MVRRKEHGGFFNYYFITNGLYLYIIEYLNIFAFLSIVR